MARQYQAGIPQHQGAQGPWWSLHWLCLLQQLPQMSLVMISICCTRQTDSQSHLLKPKSSVSQLFCSRNAAGCCPFAASLWLQASLEAETRKGGGQGQASSWPLILVSMQLAAALQISMLEARHMVVISKDAFTQPINKQPVCAQAVLAVLRTFLYVLCMIQCIKCKAGGR